MVVKRTETIEAVKEVPIKFGNYKLRYAWVSQRGYYPDTPHKANQDAHVEIENYCADQGFEDMHLFGVFDGHGSKGTECAQWAAEQVPLELARRLKEHPDDMERCFKEAFLEVNTSLHKNKQIEDRLSGTTAIVVLVNKGTLHIANVGDSRAIVAQLLDSKLAAYSLSQDQTPFRKDERERCKRAGAVIASLDQLEGEEDMHEDWGDTADTGGAEGDDPPRLWLPGQMTPGCAFTRSIGDSVGESIGCIAEPELLTKQLVASDKFLVLASDGVWEFMTNQMVADMVAGFESPLKACKAVVQEAYKLWLQFDVRTDDITMSLVMLDGTEGVEAALLAEQARQLRPAEAAEARASGPARAGLRRQSTANLRLRAAIGAAGAVQELARRPSAAGVTLGAKAVEGEQVRPVRRAITREKRATVQGPSAPAEQRLGGEEETGWTFESAEGALPIAEQAEIGRAVATNFLLAHLNAEQQALAFGRMQACTARQGDTIIAKGQPGDWFYVVASGSYDVLIGDEAVLSYCREDEADAYPSFGELALLYSKPRAATVVCSAAGKLWRLHRTVFHEVTRHTSAQQLTKTLRGVEVLKSLTISQLQRLQDALSEVHRPKGAKVIAQGDAGKEFYIIMQGQAAVTVKDGAQVREVMKLGQLDYFGERALLNDAPRAATVTALTDLELLCISKTLFDAVLGPLDRLLDLHRRQREERAQATYLQRQAEGLLDVTEEEFEPMAKVGSAAHQDTYLVVRRIEKHLAEPGLVEQVEQAEAEKRASLAASGAASGSAAGGSARLSSLGAVYTSADGAVIEQRFSLRVLPKRRVVEADMQRRVLEEVRLLGALPPSPFVPALLATFCDVRRLYAVLGSVLVTDLHAACDAQPLAEQAARFYVAAAFRALSCVHRLDAVCRACSLEAIMLDAKGYPQLADLSLAKVLASGRTHTLCGTPDYLAPEVVRMAGHGIEADYWALGVLMFELLAAHSPWEAASGEGGAASQPKDEMQVYAAISAHGGEGAPPLPFPASLSQPARDMIDQLMEPDLADRLGCRGAGPEDLTEGTEWLVGFPWAALDQRLDPGAEAEPQWNLFRPKCEALASRFFNPDAAAEEVEFDAPPYYGENRWCAEWDFMCTAGCSVADAREEGKPGLARHNSITRGTPR